MGVGYFEFGLNYLPITNMPIPRFVFMLLSNKYRGKYHFIPHSIMIRFILIVTFACCWLFGVVILVNRKYEYDNLKVL